jgi:hypothetical protein
MLLYLHCLFMEVFQRPLVLFLFANRGCFSIADAKVRQKSESASISARKNAKNTHFLHFRTLRKGFYSVKCFLHPLLFTRAIRAHNNLLGRMRAEFTHHLYILEKLSLKKHSYFLFFFFRSHAKKRNTHSSDDKKSLRFLLNYVSMVYPDGVHAMVTSSSEQHRTTILHKNV